MSGEGKWVPFGRGYIEIDDLVARIRSDDPLYPHEREFVAAFLGSHWHHSATPRDHQRTTAWLVTEFVVTLQMHGFKTESLLREAEDIFRISRRRILQMVQKHRKEFRAIVDHELKRSPVQKYPSKIAPLSESQITEDRLVTSPPLSMTNADVDYDIK